MVAFIQPPDPRSLLPPLLACLPTAFVSPQPPPALLPILSPILRQRVQIFSSVSNSPTDSWLRFLCWDAKKAERVQDLIDGANFEPHPVSGEIELSGDIPATYKRIDEETLHAQISLPDFCLRVIYLWCPNDKDGGEPGWRVAELLPREGPSDDGPWYLSIGEANARAMEKMVEDALKAGDENEREASGDDDDDDYWARYDATPGRTPSIKTPAPNPISSFHRPAALSEASYFDQYADVQPALDNDDPSEDRTEIGESSLNGNMLASLLQRQLPNIQSAEPPRTNGYSPGTAANEHVAMLLNHPRPSSASSGSSHAVAKLEQEAETQSACEVGVKQHISSNIKSLFRLAKSTGISRTEFQSLVKTELELLSLSDDE